MDYPGPEGCLYDGLCYLCEIDDNFISRAIRKLECQLVKAEKAGLVEYLATLPLPNQKYF